MENSALFSSYGFLNEDQQKRVMSAQVQGKQRLIAHAIRLNDEQSVTENVRQLLHISVPYDVKFFNLNFKELLQKNSDSVNDLRKLRDGLLILQKYGTNLMQPPFERPKQWRIISRSIVDSMRGCKDVLMEIGYIVETAQSLEFPLSLQPDLTHISLILADIALALEELDAYLDGSHSAARFIDDCIKPQSIILQTNVHGTVTNYSGSNNASSNVSLHSNNVTTGSIGGGRVPIENSASFATSSFGDSASLQSRNSHIGRDAAMNIIASPVAIVNPVIKATREVNEEDDDHMCDVCGQKQWNNLCSLCDDNKLTCDSCNALLHGHRKRSSHRVDPVEFCDFCGLNYVRWKCSSCEINKLLCNGCNVNVHKNPRRSQHQPLPYRYVVLSIATSTAVPKNRSDLPMLDSPFSSENKDRVAKDTTYSTFIYNEPSSSHNLNAAFNKNYAATNVAGRTSAVFQTASGNMDLAPYRHELPQRAYEQNYVDLARMPDAQKTQTSYAGKVHSAGADRQKFLHGSAGDGVRKKYLETPVNLNNDSSSEYEEASDSLPEHDNYKYGSTTGVAAETIVVKDEQTVFLELQMASVERGGQEMVSSIRQAERENFHVDEYLLARLQNRSAPLSWLDNTWTQLQDAAHAGAAKELATLGEDVALIRPCDVKASLVTSACCMESSVRSCRDSAVKKIDVVSRLLWCGRESATMALCTNAGSSSEVCKSLHESMLTDFCTKWKATEDDNTSLYKTIEELLCQVVDRERRVRMLLAELHLSCWADGERILSLWEHFANNNTVTLADIVEAHGTCSSVDEMKAFLQWECVTCTGLYPASQFLKLAMCECRICRGCMREYFNVQISESHVVRWTCPACQNPDMASSDADVHLQFLDSTLRGILSDEKHELFEKRLRDWHLMSDPNFRWCQGGGGGCDSGSIYNVLPGQLRIVCIDCSKAMCFKCKKPWEAQHENVSCDEFALWKLDNDPQHQAQALANYLEENGIDCPQCKYRFALAKGGCMHFKCNRCTHEFCCGCSEPFKHGSSCKKFAACASMGLHCHHPRDCLFYLRDMSLESLRRLLQNNNVTFEREQQLAENSSQTCTVMEQKEVGATLRDEACGREVKDSCGGLCEVHYKEYLVGLINRHGIDPVSVWTIDDMENELKRNNKTLPVAKQQSQQERMSTLAQVIQNDLPLQRSVSRTSNLSEPHSINSLI